MTAHPFERILHPRVTTKENDVRPQVGEAHSDSGGGILPPDQDPGNENPWWKKPVLKMGATVVATAVLVGGGMKMLDKDGPQAPPRAEATTSAPATTGPTAEIPTVAPSTESSPIPSATETNANYDAKLLTLEAMSIQNFVKADLNDQLLYGWDKNTEVSQDAILNGWLDQELKDDKRNVAECNPVDSPTNQFALGPNIKAQNIYNEAIVKAWKLNPHEDPKGAQKYELDEKTALKLASSYALPGSPAYASMVKTLMNMDHAGGLADDQVIFTVENTTPLKDVGVEYEGEQLKGKVLTVNSGGNTFIETYVFKPFDGYGDDNGVWLLVERVDELDAKKSQ